jgi:uncharacterized membrane protein YgcG
MSLRSTSVAAAVCLLLAKSTSAAAAVAWGPAPLNAPRASRRSLLAIGGERRGLQSGGTSTANTTDIPCMEETVASYTCNRNTLSAEAQVECEACMGVAYDSAYPALEASTYSCDGWTVYACAPISACPCTWGCLDEYNREAECLVLQDLALRNATETGTCDINCGSTPSFPPSGGGNLTNTTHTNTTVTCKEETVAWYTCLRNAQSAEAEVECDTCALDALDSAYPALEASNYSCGDWTAYVCAPKDPCPCTLACLDEYNPYAECVVSEELALQNDTGTGTCDINCGSTPPPSSLSGGSNSSSSGGTGAGTGGTSSGGGGTGGASGPTGSTSSAGRTTSTKLSAALMAMAAASSIAFFA